MAAIERIHRRHQPVRGVTPEGRPFHALDPDLLLWVHATLLHTSVQAFELFVRPLDAWRRARLYDESMTIAELLGIPRRHQPPTWGDFESYFASMVEGPELRVGRSAAWQQTTLFKSRPSESWSSLLTLGPPGRWGILLDHGPARWATYLMSHELAAALLPEKIAAGFGYGTGRLQRVRRAGLLQVLSRAIPALPPRLRFHPAYWRAVERLGA